VDDGSTDGTTETVLGYETRFCNAGIDFIFVHQENKGLCEALMAGFQHVEGTFLSNPEYDDFLLPTSVEKRVNYLKAHPDCAVVVADAWLVEENDLANRTRYISGKNPNRFDRNHFYQCLMSNTIFNAACYMVRMESFDQTHQDRKLIPYPYGSNQQILLPLYYHWNRGFIDEPLSVSVSRKGSLSKKKNSFSDDVERDLAYKDLLYSILDGIEMPDSDRLLYKERVELNIQKDYYEFGKKYGKHDLADKAKRFLTSHGEPLPVIHSEKYTLRHYLRNLLPFSGWLSKQ
jgi:glycosyltransferase involved in cell wall biosynthesis